YNNSGNEINSSSILTNIVTDSAGNSYLAVTPSQQYKGVRVKLRYANALLGINLGGGLKMKVYDAFYYTGGEKCGRPAYTALSETGIDISLLDFGDNHAERAIDNDENSYSTVKSTAVLNVNLAAT